MAMFCPKCGSKVTKAFCTKCGTRMPQEEPRVDAAPARPVEAERPAAPEMPIEAAAPEMPIKNAGVKTPEKVWTGDIPWDPMPEPEEPEKPKKPRSVAAVIGAILLAINTLTVLITACMAYVPANLQKLVGINEVESAAIKTAVKGCLPFVLIFVGLYLVISVICLFSSFVMRKSKAASRLMLIHLPIMIAATAVLVYTPVSVLGLTGIANRTILAILAAGSSKAIFTASVIFLAGWWSGFVCWVAAYLLLKLGGAKEKKLAQKAEKAEKGK